MSRKHDVIVAVFSRSDKQSGEKIAPEGTTLVHLRDLPLPRYVPLPVRFLLEILERAMGVAFLVRTLRPNIVIGNWITRDSGLYCALAGYHPFLAVAWGSDILVEAKRSLILRVLARFTLRVADGVIVDSEIQRRAILSMGCRSSKIYCFPWGIDLHHFRHKKTKRVRAHFGRLHEKIVVSTRRQLPIYGVEYLIRAMPLVLARMNDVKLLVIGDGPLLEYHKSLVRRLGIGNQVEFMGNVANHLLPEILNAADVYVSTSFSDGSSASLMEAMACGLPVVVTRIPANEEWVVHGENGFLVNPGDSVTLAKYLITVLRDEELRSHMGKGNLQVAKNRADWRVNSQVLEKAVYDLLASRAPDEDTSQTLERGAGKTQRAF
ncbi:MAG: glycosyltransferase [Candidatus Bathyarchaeia archaeon]|jgi:glycosyltransferase involved in cell wall biosynthesis